MIFALFLILSLLYILSSAGRFGQNSADYWRRQEDRINRMGILRRHVSGAHDFRSVPYPVTPVHPVLSWALWAEYRRLLEKTGGQDKQDGDTQTTRVRRPSFSLCFVSCHSCTSC